MAVDQGVRSLKSQPTVFRPASALRAAQENQLIDRSQIGRSLQNPPHGQRLRGLFQPSRRSGIRMFSAHSEINSRPPLP